MWALVIAIQMNPFRDKGKTYTHTHLCSYIDGAVSLHAQVIVRKLGL